MQLSNLKKLYIQNSLSKNINLRKKAETQLKIINLYKSKYNYELSDEVGISLAAEEIKEKLESGYKDSYYNFRLEALNSCIIKYLKVEEISALSQKVDLSDEFSLKNFYIQLKARCKNEIAKCKKEDIIKAFNLLEVARDSANSNNS